jgi:O-antigen ligase
MTARAELPTRALQAALLAAGLVVGLLAGLQPPLALLFALGLAFFAITLANLTAGLCLFAVLTFLDTIVGDAGGGLSVSKLLGILLVLSWLALITAGEQEERGRIFSHAGFLYVLILFIGWVALSITWAEVPGEVTETLQRYVPNAMLFLIVFSGVRTREQAMWLVGAFVVGALASAVYGLLVPTDPEAAERLSGAGGNANETAAALVAGAALAVALAAALRDQPLLRLAALIVVPLCAYGIFLTLSRGGLVALGAAVVAAVVMAGRWRATAVALALAAVVGTVVYFGVFAPPEARARVTEIEGGTGRVDIWTVAWRVVEAEPLRGVGAGNFNDVSIHYLLQPGAIARDDFIVDTPAAAHNTYLELLAELGVVGLVGFLAIVGFALTCAFKAVRAFQRGGDAQMEIISRALFVALIGLLAADFFGSRQYSKQLWLLMSLAPALLAIARAQLGTQRAGGSLPHALT